MIIITIIGDSMHVCYSMFVLGCHPVLSVTVGRKTTCLPACLPRGRL
jgi:hypothetical protein